MTDELSESKVKWLTYLVYILITIITIVSGWNTVNISAMPDKYVRLERYQTDSGRIECTLQSINAKLDRLIERKIQVDQHN